MIINWNRTGTELCKTVAAYIHGGDNYLHQCRVDKNVFCTLFFIYFLHLKVRFKGCPFYTYNSNIEAYP